VTIYFNTAFVPASDNLAEIHLNNLLPAFINRNATRNHIGYDLNPEIKEQANAHLSSKELITNIKSESFLIEAITC